jgi:DNA-binding transcriptional ArsR family regulator
MSFQQFTDATLQAIQSREISLQRLRETGDRARQIITLSAADGDWVLLRQIGVSLTRMAGALSARAKRTGWSYSFEVLGELAEGLVEEMAPGDEVSKLLASIKGAQLVDALMTGERIPASTLRRRIGEKHQSNLGRQIRPLIRARFVAVSEGSRNSKYYRLTAHGRQQLDEALSRRNVLLGPHPGQSRSTAPRADSQPIAIPRSRLRFSSGNSRTHVHSARG